MRGIFMGSDIKQFPSYTKSVCDTPTGVKRVKDDKRNRGRDRVSISVKGMQRQFTKKEKQTDYKHRKKQSISHTVKEKQIKTVMRCLFPLSDRQAQFGC